MKGRQCPDKQCCHILLFSPDILTFSVCLSENVSPEGKESWNYFDITRERERERDGPTQALLNKNYIISGLVGF